MVTPGTTHVQNEVIGEFKVRKCSIQLCRKLVRLSIVSAKLLLAHPRRLLNEVEDGGRQLIVTNADTLLQHLINFVDCVLNSGCGLILHNSGSVCLHAKRLLRLARLEIRLGNSNGTAGGNGICSVSTALNLNITEGLLGLDKSHGKLAANRDLLQHTSDLKVASTSQILLVDGLNVVSDTARLHARLHGEKHNGIGTIMLSSRIFLMNA